MAFRVLLVIENRNESKTGRKSDEVICLQKTRVFLNRLPMYM